MKGENYSGDDIYFNLCVLVVHHLTSTQEEDTVCLSQHMLNTQSLKDVLH